MIFAAGFGTRMRPLTDDRPKPLIEVAGKPLIDHTLDLVRAASPETVAVNLHYRAEMLEDHLANAGVEILTESPEILDTGGGLRNALPVLGPEPVYTTNSDAIWQGPNPFELLRAAWDPARMDALLVCVPPDRAVGRKGPGDFLMDDTGRLTRGPGVVYGGVQILKTDMLRHIPDDVFSLWAIWSQMLSQGRMFGLIYPGKWCDIGHPEGIALAEALLEQADV